MKEAPFPPTAPLVECVPNLSEGRDPAIVAQIEAAIAQDRSIVVLGSTMDPDHHRSVITFAGPPESVAAAAIRAVRTARDLIDLNHHSGVHPRIGAADVVPFVPIRNITLEQCAALARRVAEEIAATLEVPTYLYEAAATRPDRKALENIRKGGWELLKDSVLTDPGRHPDFGGPALHPTAGATAVGARKLLIAYNIDLATPDLAVAQKIAREIRASSGGLPSVKALGLYLPTRGCAQVSMNLTDTGETPLHKVWETVRNKAIAIGTDVVRSEIIGFISQSELNRASAYFLRWDDFANDRILETHLESLHYK